MLRFFFWRVYKSNNQINKSNQINFIPIMGPRGANRNYTYSKITHINSQEGKS